MVNYKINRMNPGANELDRGDGDDWLYRMIDQMDKNAGKTAVEVARERTENITDKIRSIVNNTYFPSRYSSVEEAVEDYQKRTGLLEYQKKSFAQEIIDAGNDMPSLIKRFPGIESFIENLLTTNPFIQLPAVLQSVFEVYSRRGVTRSDVDDAEFASYVNDMIIAHGKSLPYEDHQIGQGVGIRNDYLHNDSNRDPFINLEPKRNMW